jgi:hypothetical protein
MARGVAWSVGVVAVLPAVVSGVAARPEEVTGRAGPWSGDAPTAEVVAAFEQCVAQVGTDEAFTLGPAYLRDDGLLVIGAISDDTLMSCGVEERRISVGTSKPVDYSTREVPFGSASTTGYENRPGGTTVGYAGDDVAAVHFSTPDGRVIRAGVSRGVFSSTCPARRSTTTRTSPTWRSTRPAR